MQNETAASPGPSEVRESSDQRIRVVTEYEALLARAERLLDDVDRSLVRLGDGTYHDCEICRAPIDEAALAEQPTLRTCVLHT
jgi:RNA polymerase-binding transcription factor DksA